jgi:hypothetical protein
MIVKKWNYLVNIFLKRNCNKDVKIISLLDNTACNNNDNFNVSWREGKF